MSTLDGLDIEQDYKYKSQTQIGHQQPGGVARWGGGGGISIFCVEFKNTPLSHVTLVRKMSMSLVDSHR